MWMVGEPARVSTAGDPAECRERSLRVRWRVTGWLWRWRVCGVGWDGELREGRYWDVGLCTGVGVSGGVGSSVGGPISYN